MTGLPSVHLTRPDLTVPVLHLDASGRPSTDAHRALPLVKVRFSWQPIRHEGGRAHVEGLRDTLALIDTGCDYSLLSHRFFEGCGPPVETWRHTGLGVVSEETTSHEITMFFPPADILTRCGVMRSSAIPENSPFQMILGRHFLKMTRFVYDGPAGIQRLEFLDQEELDRRGVR